MTCIQAHAQRFFLNEDLWLEDCECSLDESSLHLSKGEKSFDLALDNIAFTGFRKATDDKPAAVVLCQSSAYDEDMLSEEQHERPESFDDLVVEFAKGEDALKFHKALESAVSKITARDEQNVTETPSSSSGEDVEEEDLPSRMMREDEAQAL